MPGYRIIEEIGRGGFGAVYRAEDLKVGREVALKTLLRDSAADLRQFKAEFRSLAGIAHDNLVGLYDLHFSGETWFFTMELLEAVEFNEFVWSEFDAKDGSVRKDIPLVRPDEVRLNAARLERLRSLILQLANGLNSLHKAGMLHHDIKPSNVLVTAEGRVVLVDFGLAVKASEGMLMTVAGTPAYMAPEQATGEPTSPASDWYAVGTMLYEVLAGLLPFAGPPRKVLRTKLQFAPQEPFELQPNIPAELNELCMALLQIEADLRPSVTEVLRVFGEKNLAGMSADTPQPEQHFVGRGQHLQVLADYFELQNETHTVFVHGQPGMGKSALMDQFLGDVRKTPRALVLEGRCYEEENVPFKALDSLVDALAAYIANLPDKAAEILVPEDPLPLVQLFPALAGMPGVVEADTAEIQNADQQELRQRAVLALRRILAALGARKRLVLFVDDLQWGDIDSARLLADIVRPPSPPRLLLVGAYRTEHIGTSPCLIALQDAFSTGEYLPHHEEVSLGPLTTQEAEVLAAALMGPDAASTEVARKIGQESGGWPFFVCELALAWRDWESDGDDVFESVTGTLLESMTGTGLLSAGDTELTEGGSSERRSFHLMDAISARVDRLAPETRQLLEVIAVSARPVRVTTAYRATGNAARGQTLLLELRAGRFARTSMTSDATLVVETYHDWIRECVVSDLSDAAVREHNLRLAEAIEEMSGISDHDRKAWLKGSAAFSDDSINSSRDPWDSIFDLAHHFGVAEEYDRARPYALVAAERAMKQNALEVAETHFRIAEQGSEVTPFFVRFRIADGLGDVLMLSGQYAEAEVQMTAAREYAGGKLARALIDRKLGELAFKCGNMTRSAEILEVALRNFDQWVPGNMTSQLFAVGWECVVQFLHTLLPAVFVHRIKTVPPEAMRVQIGLLSRLAYVNWFARGAIPTMWAHLRELNLAERYLPGLELAQAWSEHAPALTMIPLHDRGIDYARRSVKLRRMHGHLWGAGQSLHFLGVGLYAAARIKEAVEAWEESYSILDRAGDRWEANLVRYQLGLAYYHLGELDTAIDLSVRVHREGLEIGDEQASGISLHCWAMASRGQVPADILEVEIGRERFDAQCTTQVLLAEALRLYFADDLDGASGRLNECMSTIRRHTLRSYFVAPVYTWRATVRRTQLERTTPDSPERRTLLRQTRRSIRAAARIGRAYRIELPHALREAGELARILGQTEKSTQLLRESLKEAERLELKFQADMTQQRIQSQ